MKKITITVKDLLKVLFVVVDLFCGAGGTTTGFANTNGIAKVVACVNHDPIAIKSHWENHPEVKHFEEDIRTLDLTELAQLIQHCRKIYPNAKIILWASLECTNFSKAKGGLPRDADSRTLAQSLIMKWDPKAWNPKTKTFGKYIKGDSYIQLLKPDIIQIENVVEFMRWGPLDENGKPVSKDAGSYWLQWRKQIRALGYHDEWNQLNSANFGAYTSRNRLFGMFSSKKEWIQWPESTHFKNPSTGNLFAAPQKWKPVKEVLDFDDEGNSIFNRKKNLSPKTYERIYAGLIKYVAGGEKEFIAKYYSGRPKGKVISINGPAGTLRTTDSHSLIQSKFLMQNNSGNASGKVYSAEMPARTITCTGGNQNIVQPCFLAKYYSNGGQLNSINEPSPTIPTKDRISKIQTVWLDKQFSGPANHQSIDQPAGSILSNDKHSLINTVWLDRPFKTSGWHQSVDQPAGAILSVPKFNMIQSKFLLNQNSSTAPANSMDKPSPTITQRTHYIVNPSWFGNAGSIDAPCCTIVARQDKAPLSMVTAHSGNLAIAIYDTDSEPIIKIKHFMAAYGIVDIKMRMLKIPELLKIQGFPSDYILKGTQADQKKFIGNSVHPLVPENWIYALAKVVAA
jgi:DNA (cytosine-5)-methyltransferase 1